MEQKHGAIVKYGAVGPIAHGDYLIEAWAQKDERLPAFYGVARYCKSDQADAPFGWKTLPGGMVPTFTDSRDAVEWAVKESKLRIAAETGPIE